MVTNPMRAAIALLFVFTSASASLSIKPSLRNHKMIDVVIHDEPLSAVVAALEWKLDRPVKLEMPGDPVITFERRKVTAEVALEEIVAGVGLELRHDEASYTILDPAEPVVSLDVKDAEVRLILGSMKTQCGIRNLMIDPDVQGTGTFLFDRVPCGTALDVVLRTFGLEAEMSGTTVLAVGHRHP